MILILELYESLNLFQLQRMYEHVANEYYIYSAVSIRFQSETAVLTLITHGYCPNCLDYQIHSSIIQATLHTAHNC